MGTSCKYCVPSSKFFAGGHAPNYSRHFEPNLWLQMQSCSYRVISILSSAAQCLLAADKVALGNMPPVKYKLCSPDRYLSMLAPTKWRKVCEKLQFSSKGVQSEREKERRRDVGNMQIKRDGLLYLMTKVVADRAEITFPARRLLCGSTISSIPPGQT